MRAANAVYSLLLSLASLTAFAGTTGSWERDRGCVFPVTQDVVGLVERWRRALAKGDTAALAAAYSPDAILMGIGETAIRLGRREIEAHYTTLLRDKVAVASQSHVIEADCGVAVVTGLQRFDVGTGARSASAEVAYKMMFAYGEGDWMLIHHHLEPLSDFVGRDVPLGFAGASSVTTGTLPVANRLPDPTQLLVLPPPAFALSMSPPVLVADHLPRILSSSRPSDPAIPGPVPAPVVAEVIVPPLAIETGRFPLVAKPANTPPAVVVVVVPPLKISIGAFPAMAAVQPQVSQPQAVRPKLSDIVVPRLGIDVGTFPALSLAASSTATVPPGAAQVAAPASPPEPPQLTPARAPAVASFAQRAAAARPASGPNTKSAKSQPVAAKPSAAAAPAPTKSSTPYRPVRRWNDAIPIFEDD